MGDSHYVVLGAEESHHASAQDTGGAVGVIEQRAPHGFAPPFHVHEREDSVLIVLDGRVRARRGDEEVILEAGESVRLPRGVPHAYRVESREGARLVEVLTPGGFEAFHASLAEIPEADEASMSALAAEHGCTILGPPWSRAERVSTNLPSVRFIDTL